MKTLNLLTISAAVAGVLASTAATADLTGNVAVSNNYLWRGVTQTDDMAAVSGGIDYSNASGVYAGGWVSNTDFTDAATDDGTYELDVYFGYAGETDSFSYDVGYIAYVYPLDTDLDFSEIYGGIEVMGISLNLALTVDTDWGGDDSDMYVSAGYSFDVGNDSSLDLTIGNYDYDAAGSEDYTHYAVYLSNGDFAFGLEANDKTGDDDARIVVSYGKSFEL